MDLMWGLPGLSVRQWLQTLKDAVRMSPDHISAYGLTLEPGTPLERDCEEGRLALPLPCPRHCPPGTTGRTFSRCSGRRRRQPFTP
ncbi:hypothetical protein [uncultured Desulfovibrio sp.]|uniref:hypothetical protein n=1 Tax=uncultured Desulfovibrio sp. TaxID=167968 RepID=UPI00351A09B8